MAWSTPVSLGSVANKTAATTLVLTTVAIAEVDKVIIVPVACDNIATVDGDQGDIVSVTDSAGNTYTKARQRTNGQGAAAAGASVALYFTKVTTELPSGGTITATFNGSPAAKAMRATKFTITAANVVTVEGGADGTVEDATTAPTATISGLTSREYLWLAGIAVEGPSGDTYTEDLDYTQLAVQGTTGGAAPSNMTIRSAFRIFTGTTDTHAPTLGTARDLAHVYVALKEAAAAAVQPVFEFRVPSFA